MKIVADTGPIIGLAKIRKIYMLKHLSDEVLIPPMVHRELLGKIGPESCEIDAALNSIIKTTDLPRAEEDVGELVSALDEGEKQAISLAYGFMDDILLLMDDHAGRAAAYKLHIPVTGLLGLLLKSKEKGLIQNFTAIAEELRQNGYWLSDDIVEIAKKLAGE